MWAIGVRLPETLKRSRPGCLTSTYLTVASESDLTDRTENLLVNQSIVATAMMRAFVPIAAGAGVVLLAIAAFTGDWQTFPLGLTGLAIGAVGYVQQRRSEPGPLVLLVVATVGCAVSAPFLERGEAIALVATVTLFSLVGVFSLHRRAAWWFMVWCGGVVVWMLGWHLPGMTAREGAIGLFLLLATGVAGWRVFAMAGDALASEQDNSRLLFESSPVAILEEDFTEVAAWLEQLRSESVDDLRSFLTQHPEQARHGISLIKIRQANLAAAELLDAGSADELLGSFGVVSRRDVEIDSFVDQFVAIWKGRRSLALDLKGVTLNGRPLEAVLHWSVPVSRGRADLSRVIVAISDITPRKVVEESLARAVESNERLLAFEKALAACSRALLLGVGEDALDIALETLREAMGADRAYLAVNLDDGTVGPAFRVVNSTSKPEFAQDDWLGMVVPWSKYPMTTETLARGDAFQHVPSDLAGEGWSRAVLAVPIFTGGEWTGTAGFVDIARRTRWGDEAVRMLEVAAPMLGTFWERETTRLRLEDLVQSKDRFVASISHELRTPLSAVMGFAEELASQAASFEPHEATEILELIAEQSRDMADMVEDLLVAARADIGTISIHPQKVYLRAQVEVALVALGPAALTTVEVVGGPGRVWADPTRTKQIIRNLLTNAVRYGGSQVVVEAVSNGRVTCLSIRDNGPGLPETEWERIFEPYERAHERPTQPASVGLGLTVSRQLARAMGGDLTYHADDRGSHFELTLPSRPPGEAHHEDLVHGRNVARQGS